MDIRKLEPGLDVTGQIPPGDVPALAALGYRAIVSNRPDGEEVGQPRTEDALLSAARDAGYDLEPLRPRLAA